MEENNGIVPESMGHLSAFDSGDVDDVTQLNRVLAELGSDEETGAFVSVFRVNKVGKDGEFLNRYDAAEFADGSLLETVREQWGPGRYQFSVYHGSGGLRARKVIQIAPLPGAVQVAPVRQQDDRMDRMFEMIQQNQRALADGLAGLAAAIAQAPPKRESEMDVLERLRTMKELLGPGEVGKTGDVQAFLEGVKLARELGGGGGEESNSDWLSKALERFAIPAMEHLTRAQPAPTAGVPRETAKPALPVQARPQQPKEESEASMMLKMGIMMLKSAAAKNEDVQDVADRVMLMLPMADLEMLVNLPNWFEVLCHHDAGCAPFKAWFDRLHAELKGLLEAEKNAPPGEE